MKDMNIVKEFVADMLYLEREGVLIKGLTIMPRLEDALQALEKKKGLLWDSQKCEWYTVPDEEQVYVADIVTMLLTRVPANYTSTRYTGWLLGGK